MKEIEIKRMEEVSSSQKSRLAFPFPGNFFAYSPDSVSLKYAVVPTFCEKSLISVMQRVFYKLNLALYGSLSFPTSLETTRNTWLLVGCLALYGSLSFPTSLETTRNTWLLVGCLALYGSLSFPTSLETTRNTWLLVGCLALYGSLDI
ncbi:hypothetical protein [Leptospira borgpetersenii]|uniref:hypothetical protein n=2 Tax=Leptospira borgpetersenii TaxID=174 RepID=UPI0005194B8F|nr:hypothetical protein [Leptospira borgpetersenii]